MEKKVRPDNQKATSLFSASPTLATAGSTDTMGHEIIPAKPVTYENARNVKLPCHMFKPHVRNPDFFDRTAVLQLLDKTLFPDTENMDSNATLKTFALCGMGG